MGKSVELKVVLVKPTVVAGESKNKGDEITVTKEKAEILKTHGFIECKEVK